MKAHHHFTDTEWDGEPLEPEVCVSEGVDELDQDKLSPLLRLKYHDSIADAVADLGDADRIGILFSGFHRYLYQQDLPRAHK